MKSTWSIACHNLAKYFFSMQNINNRWHLRFGETWHVSYKVLPGSSFKYTNILLLFYFKFSGIKLHSRAQRPPIIWPLPLFIQSANLPHLPARYGEQWGQPLLQGPCTCSFLSLFVLEGPNQMCPWSVRSFLCPSHVQEEWLPPSVRPCSSLLTLHFHYSTFTPLNNHLPHPTRTWTQGYFSFISLVSGTK